jgi:hypothetical protein
MPGGTGGTSTAGGGGGATAGGGVCAQAASAKKLKLTVRFERSRETLDGPRCSFLDCARNERVTPTKITPPPAHA